jgi:chemotaxis protein MotB
MARRRQHEVDEPHEAWAIPYGDLVTLLLAFFVVMYSMSSVNAGKYRVLSNSLSEAFRGVPNSQPSSNTDTTPLQPIAQRLPLTQVHSMIAAGLPDHQLLTLPPDSASAATLAAGVVRAAPGAPGAAAASSAASELPAVAGANRGATTAGAAMAPSGATAGEANSERELNRVAADVSAALGPLIATGQVHVRRYSSWVAVDISTDILFPSGVARLSRPAVQALERLAAVLAPWPNAVRVEGHTDNRPIDTRQFPSNWELSAARAASVVHLFMDRGISPGRLAVLGFGQYQPVASNQTAAGRNANRRVAVVILGSNAAPEVGL